MKKLLQSTIVLLCFTSTVVLFDLSCKKESKAQTNNVNGVAIANQMLFITSDGSIGIENYDGYNQQKINIVLPQGVVVSTEPHLAISPDHKTIFFSATYQGPITANQSLSGGYSCNIDGSNVKKIDNSAVHVPF